jgi:hypothetical protein
MVSVGKHIGFLHFEEQALGECLENYRLAINSRNLTFFI